MQIDLGTRESVTFCAGLIGLTEQAVMAVFGVDPSRDLILAFLAMVIGPAAFELFKSGREKN